MNITVVFDIDDTISTHINRDYPNAKPHKDVIDKINFLHDELGYKIKLYTSRGMGSTNGNIELAKSKNENILIEWLKKNNVHYDELLFGKPLGDLYVDDKCLDVKDFMKEEFYPIHNGGSGKSIERIGKIVKKECNHEEVESIKSWSKEIESLKAANLLPKYCSTPHIISSLYECIYMDYIEGETLCNVVSFYDLAQINNIIESFANIVPIKCSSFDTNILINATLKNKSEYGKGAIDAKIDRCNKLLESIDKSLKNKCSFCHGDFTFSNIIRKDYYFYYLVDSHMNEKASTYLLDYAKVLVSLLGYEFRFGLGTKPTLKLRDMLEYELLYLNNLNILKECIILTYMHFIRMWRYKSIDDRYILLDILNEMEIMFKEELTI